MFSSISRRYDLLNDTLSLGIHRIWKRELISTGVAHLRKVAGSKVLDLATGTGDLAFGFAKRTPESVEIFGADFCAPMIEEAARRQAAQGMARIQFRQGDALALEFSDQSLDLVSVSFGARNFADISKGMSEIARVLKPNGLALILEFGRADSFVGRAFEKFNSAWLPFWGGLLTGNSDAYRYLHRSSEGFPSGEDFLALCKKAGFASCEYRRFFPGNVFLYSLRK
jgi:demethylmenaquinone methyltransferase/2-methoxy-6-polyprenyl-1,4-benzoquinol methylase